MFDLRLTDEQEAFTTAARKFAAERIIPVAGEYDEKGEMPLPVFRAAFDVGLMNVEIPEAYGGLGLHTLEGCLIAEELAYGCAGVATSIMCNHLGALPLMIAGTEAQKQEWLGGLTSGFGFVSYCCSEPEAGSDVAAMRTRLTKSGDGWVLTGQKRWITNGGYARFFTGFATIDPAARHKGITAFVIPRDLPGVSIGHKENKLGQRCSNTVDVIFEDVKLGPEHLLGEPGGGFAVAMETFDKSRPMIASQCAGMIRRCLDESAKYAKERKTFGKPIAEHQAVSFRLADMAVKVEASHQMMVMAARKKDSGERNDMEAGMAKYLASEYCKEVVEDSFRIHGGYGYSKEYEIERLYREAPMLLIGEGTADIQRMIIARRLLEEYKNRT